MSPIREYRHFVNWLRAETGSSPELLHIDCGLALWLVAALVLGKPLGSIWPVLVVLAAAVANEIMDALYWHHVESSAGVDVFNSVAWPAVIMLAVRFTRLGR